MKAKSAFSNTDAWPAEGTRGRGKPFRVLIVDDSAAVAAQIRNLLTAEGFQIAGAASDGQEGLEKYQKLYPAVDLVMMDITMPKMDGVTALGEILKFDKNAKVIMISALGKQEEVKRSLLIGAKGYIDKPLERKKVLDRVLRVLKA